MTYLTFPPRHVVYAPSSVNAYGGTSFPGVTDAIFEALNFGGSWVKVQHQIDLVRVHILYASQIMGQQYGYNGCERQCSNEP